jgi:RepB DNA-primase from phage plasmid
MTENVKPSGTPELLPLLISDHVQLIHMFAETLVGRGIVVIAGFGEDPNQIDPKTGKPGRRLPPKVGHAVVGDVRQTLLELNKFIGLPHYNAYTPLAIFRPDLPPGTKGSERDIVASLGLVADFDDPDAARWAKRLPLPPNYVLETSAGRFQAFYLFDKPEAVEVVKLVAERLKKFAGCDHGTSDISHVWRISAP